MRKKNTVSPYSMMYLVTPAIYEKLLLCIDEGDKKLLDSLNKPPESIQDRRPAQVRLDALSTQELQTRESISQNPAQIVDQPMPLQLDQVNTGVHIINPEDIAPTVSTDTPTIDQNITTPVAIPNINDPLQNTPVSITVTPQVDAIESVQPVNPLQPSINIRPEYQATVKPVVITPADNLTQPAGFSQPIQPNLVVVDNRASKRASDQPQDQDAIKRQRLKGNMFYERDQNYKDNMLKRIKAKKNQNPIELVQWQPLQCVNNTTGGQICNPDAAGQVQNIPGNTTGLISAPPPPRAPREAKISLRKDIFIRPNTCQLCGVRLGDAELLQLHYKMKHKGRNVSRLHTCQICNVRLGDDEMLQLHYRIKHKQKNNNSKDFKMPGLEVKREEEKFDPSNQSHVKIKDSKIKFKSAGSERPVSPFEYKPKVKEEKKKKRKRFTTPGFEQNIEPLNYDPTLDVPFRKGKKRNDNEVQRQPIPKPKQYRCPICKLALKNLSQLKEHIFTNHNENPDDVIRDMAGNIWTNPQPGSSRDFNNWTSLRIQPPRPTERRRQFGQLKKSTSNFETWK